VKLQEKGRELNEMQSKLDGQQREFIAKSVAKFKSQITCQKSSK
jgi:hypothetical protein